MTRTTQEAGATDDRVTWERESVTNGLGRQFLPSRFKKSHSSPRESYPLPPPTSFLREGREGKLRPYRGRQAVSRHHFPVFGGKNTCSLLSERCRTVRHMYATSPDVVCRLRFLYYHPAPSVKFLSISPPQNAIPRLTHDPFYFSLFGLPFCFLLYFSPCQLSFYFLQSRPPCFKSLSSICFFFPWTNDASHFPYFSVFHSSPGPKTSSLYLLMASNSPSLVHHQVDQFLARAPPKSLSRRSNRSYARLFPSSGAHHGSHLPMKSPFAKTWPVSC